MIDNIPHCCVATDGRVGIFLGGAYRFLAIEAAQKFIFELEGCIAEAKGNQPVATHWVAGPGDDHL